MEIQKSVNSFVKIYFLKTLKPKNMILASGFNNNALNYEQNKTYKVS